jgi:hypothetical protein
VGRAAVARGCVTLAGVTAFAERTVMGGRIRPRAVSEAALAAIGDVEVRATAATEGESGCIE